ncbi:hypothetical protein ACXWOC_10890, partial [Streptococcus pyogenes]
MRLDAAGLWTIYCRVHARATAYTGGGGVTLRVTIRDRFGSIITQPIVRGTTLINSGAVTTDIGSGTLQAIFPVTLADYGA